MNCRARELELDDMPSLLRLLAVVLVLSAAGVNSEDAGAAIRVGFGDQSPQTFDDPRFRALGIERARVVAPWNVALRRSDRVLLDRWLVAARSRGVKRLYIYHWRQPAGANRFDAGVIRDDGRARPAYRTVRRALHGRHFTP
jgi:hypothetical protein